MLLLLLTAAPLHAQEAAPSLDELLGLPGAEAPPDALLPGAGPGAGVDDAPPTDAAAPAAPAGDAPAPLDLDLSISEAADAFVQSLREMEQVSRRLGEQLDPGIQTQRLEQTILQRLEQVMAAAREQESPTPSGSPPPPQQQQSGNPENTTQQAQAQGPPQAQPTDAQQASRGQAGQDGDTRGDPRAIEETRQEWGNLPPRLRRELLEGTNEHFSPIYRDLTEAYYRRLAEESERP